MIVDVTVLYFDGCPSCQTAMERVEAASARAGVPVRVSTLAVTSTADARRLVFTGSPTILMGACVLLGGLGFGALSVKEFRGEGSSREYEESRLRVELLSTFAKQHHR